jgi:uncharacterized membrane protein YdfJ with MMPL/SSD domain
VTRDGKAFLQATMTPSPDSPAAYTLVDKIRTTVRAIPGADARVGGGTAINKDVESAAAHDRDLLIPLGIDYNIFLMTRVRQESIRSGTWQGALTGLAATGGVITSAGLVLAGTFAMLGTLPLVQFTEIGFAVALGVLLDTIVVRSVLVTALTLDIGRHVWWPSALARPGQRGTGQPGPSLQSALANPEGTGLTGGT